MPTRSDTRTHRACRRRWLPGQPAVPPNARNVGGGLFAVIGLALLMGSSVLIHGDRAFAREAVSTDGTVITKQIRTTGGRQSRSRTTHYEATYRFTVDGRTFEGRDTLTKDMWHTLTEGGAVAGLYRPGDPGSNRLQGSDASWVHVGMLLAGLVLSAVGVHRCTLQAARD